MSSGIVALLDQLRGFRAGTDWAQIIEKTRHITILAAGDGGWAFGLGTTLLATGQVPGSNDPVWEQVLEIQIVRALALRHSGRPDEAITILESSHKQTTHTPNCARLHRESEGILAAAHKALGLHHPEHLKGALEAYRRGYYDEDATIGHRAWCGVNAAVLTAATGRTQAAIPLFEGVHNILDGYKDELPMDTWSQLTRLECDLGLGAFPHQLTADLARLQLTPQQRESFRKQLEQVWPLALPHLPSSQAGHAALLQALQPN